MEVVKKENIKYERPKSSNDKEYPYAISGKIFQGKQLFLYSEKVEPGKKASAPHFHQNIDEIIYVTEGELCGYEDGNMITLTAGDSVCFYAKSEKFHYLENQSKEIAEFLIFRRSINKDDVVYK